MKDLIKLPTLVLFTMVIGAFSILVYLHESRVIDDTYKKVECKSIELKLHSNTPFETKQSLLTSKYNLDCKE